MKRDTTLAIGSVVLALFTGIHAGVIFADSTEYRQYDQAGKYSGRIVVDDNQARIYDQSGRYVGRSAFNRREPQKPVAHTRQTPLINVNPVVLPWYPGDDGRLYAR